MFSPMEVVVGSNWEFIVFSIVISNMNEVFFFSPALHFSSYERERQIREVGDGMMTDDDCLHDNNWNIIINRQVIIGKYVCQSE